MYNYMKTILSAVKYYIDKTAVKINNMIPTKISQLENDSRYLIEETDPTVPDWAKNPTKPTYTAKEVGAVSKTEYDSYVQANDAHVMKLDEVVGMTVIPASQSLKTQGIVNDIAELKEGSTDTLLFDDITVFPYIEELNMYRVSDKTPTIYNLYNGFELITSDGTYPAIPFPFGEFSPDSDNVICDEETGIIIYAVKNDLETEPDVKILGVIPQDVNLDGLVLKKGLYLAEKYLLFTLKGINIYNFSFGEYQVKGGGTGGATAEQLAQIEQNKKDISNLSDTVNNKLDADKLPEAINTALAQAKESGEFDGKDGQDGQDGKTPVKGTDYFTNADKQELVTDVLNALPTWTGGSY